MKNKISFIIFSSIVISLFSGYIVGKMELKQEKEIRENKIFDLFVMEKAYEINYISSSIDYLDEGKSIKAKEELTRQILLNANYLKLFKKNKLFTDSKSIDFELVDAAILRASTIHDK